MRSATRRKSVIPFGEANSNRMLPACESTLTVREPLGREGQGDDLKISRAVHKQRIGSGKSCDKRAAGLHSPAPRFPPYNRSGQKGIRRPRNMLSQPRAFLSVRGTAKWFGSRPIGILVTSSVKSASCRHHRGSFRPSARQARGAVSGAARGLPSERRRWRESCGSGDSRRSSRR
jgi:hypothetical protein